MRIDRAIEALRGDRSAQRLAQSALAESATGWRQGADVAPLLADLQRFGAGASLGECGALRSALTDLDMARRLTVGWVSAIGGTLADVPLGHVPFRHQLAEGFTVLQLGRASRATLSLVQYTPVEPAAPPHSVCFTDGERREICLAGRADARRVTRSGSGETKVRLTFEPASIAPGSTLAFAGRDETKIVDRIAAPLTLLRLSRQPEAPLPSLEYRLEDGSLLHRAAGDCRESRSELMLALLGRMERRDAVPAMRALSREGSDSLRWQALRECLALDSAAGFQALADIARNPADSLHAPAAKLHTELRMRYPDLARRELEPCLA